MKLSRFYLRLHKNHIKDYLRSQSLKNLLRPQNLKTSSSKKPPRTSQSKSPQPRASYSSRSSPAPVSACSDPTRQRSCGPWQKRDLPRVREGTSSSSFEDSSVRSRRRGIKQPWRLNIEGPWTPGPRAQIRGPPRGHRSTETSSTEYKAPPYCPDRKKMPRRRAAWPELSSARHRRPWSDVASSWWSKKQLRLR